MVELPEEALHLPRRNPQSDGNAVDNAVQVGREAACAAA